jgi:pimeloyl-ACP methyl ester carboxylesterase
MKAQPKTWILLRGLARNSEHWGEFIPLLQKTFPDDKILAIDLPGTGKFYQSESPTTIEAHTDFVRRQLANHSGPFHLLALSMGAMVGIDWMSRFPLEIVKACFLNTSLASFSPVLDRMKLSSLPKVISALTVTNIVKRESLIFDLTSNRAEKKEKSVKNWVAIQNKFPMRRRNAIKQLWAASRFSLKDKPSAPILFLVSAKDQLVNPQCSLTIGKAWECPIQVHPTSGHDIPHDAPEWVIEQLLTKS